MNQNKVLDLEFKGVARPGRKVQVFNLQPAGYWVYQVDIDGMFSEFSLYDGITLITRENTSLELPAPIHAHELYIEITSDQTCRYKILVTPAKE